jgi:uridine kinase
MHPNVLLIGIGGGSGSGKSALAKRIQEAAGDERVAVIELDTYYRDFSHLPKSERERLNYDHPDALDWDAILDDLSALRDGEAVELPVYDFTTHERRDEVIEVYPTPAVIVEGIHCLVHEPLRELLDIRIFVDTDADVRFIRRLRRDILDRDRSIDGVVAQYMATVRPMHNDYVEPGRRHADIIVPESTGQNQLGIELLVEAIVGRIDRFVAECAELA